MMWPCDLHLWPFDPKHWSIHPCPKCINAEFGEISSSNFQDIALKRPQSAFSIMLDPPGPWTSTFWPQNLTHSSLSPNICQCWMFGENVSDMRQDIVLTTLRMHRQTDRQTERQTDRQTHKQPECIMPPVITLPSVVLQVHTNYYHLRFTFNWLISPE